MRDTKIQITKSCTLFKKKFQEGKTYLVPKVWAIKLTGEGFAVGVVEPVPEVPQPQTAVAAPVQQTGCGCGRK